NRALIPFPTRRPSDLMSEEKKVKSATEWEDIPAEKFQIIGTDDFSGDIIARPKVGYWADAWRRFKENKIALIALIILILLVFMVDRKSTRLNSSHVSI